MKFMKFMKMHGAGNDFMIIEQSEALQTEPDFSLLARKLCQPHFSLGGDGLMIIGSPSQGGNFSMTFYNNDGSIGELCGNGARCLIYYGLHKKLCTADGTVVIETDSGLVSGYSPDYDQPQKKWEQFTVHMPELSCFQELLLGIDARQLQHFFPVTPDKPEEKTCPVLASPPYPCIYMELGSPGVPHLVLPLPIQAETSSPDGHSFSDSTEKIFRQLRPIAHMLRHHPKLPKGANVNFYQITGTHSLDLYTYERGVEDFTLACGSGASCTAGALMAKGLLPFGTASIRTTGGTLQVSCDLFSPLSQTENRIPVHNIHLSGPAVIVAEGEVFVP